MNANGGLSALPPTGSRVLVIGDSWTAGMSADPGKSWPELLAEQTGWQIHRDGQSGTGFAANLSGHGLPFPVRAARLGGQAPALVIVEGGINDSPGRALTSGIRKTVALVRAAYPGTPVVIIGPGTAGWPINDRIKTVDKTIRTEAKRLHVPYISPVKGWWITPNNYRWFINRDTMHPTNWGHAVYAARALAAIRYLAR